MTDDFDFHAIAIEAETAAGWVAPQGGRLRSPALYNRAYIPLLDNTSEFLHLWGSAGSGKSRFAGQKEIVKSFERKNRKTLIVRKVYATLANSVYSELKTIIYEWGLEKSFEMLKSPLQIVNKETDVTFVFVGLDDVEKVKSISGVDRVWIEEATELTDVNEIRQLRTRLRGFDEVQVTLSYNPIDEHHFLKTEFHDQRAPGHEFFHSTYKDNEKMLARDDSYAKFLESTKDADPNFYKVYALGEWGSVVEGLIYRQFRTDVEFPEDVHQYGLDFGFSDPTALTAQHIRDVLPTDNNPNPKRQLINKEMLYEAGLDGPALVKRFDQLGIRKDVLIRADNARPEMIKTLRDAGYKVMPSKKGAGSVLTGINLIRKFELCITSDSPNLLKEARNYKKRQLADGTWLEEPEPHQVDHGMDSIRYGAEGAHIFPRPDKRNTWEKVQALIPEDVKVNLQEARTGGDKLAAALALEFQTTIAEMELGVTREAVYSDEWS